MSGPPAGIGAQVRAALHVPTTTTLTADVLAREPCRTALDLGAGPGSPISAHRPGVRVVAVDVHAPALEEARRLGAYDAYLQADVLTADRDELLAPNGGEPYDIVTLYDVIEHLPKRQGLELLERCDELASKFVLVSTPTGFLEQGPEEGNEHQRHLSGWFPHDFEGLGYETYGATGTRLLRGYTSGPRYAFPGWGTLDALVAKAAGIRRHPRLAFHTIAVKDVRGVPARSHQATAAA